jgi:hypothetical protein
MDTSAVVHKTSSNKEKEEYRKEGQCYECGKQGHLMCNCPNQKNWQQQPCICAIKAEKNQMVNLIEFDNDNLHTDTPETLLVAVHVLCFSEKECDKFMDYMRKNGEDLDFQNA